MGWTPFAGALPSGPAEHPRAAQPPFASQQSEWWLALLVVMDHEPQCAHEARTGRHVELPEVDLSITDVIGGSRRRTLQVGLAAQAHHVTHDPRAASMRSSLSPPHLNCLRKFEDPQDRLQEASKRNPHRTQVDVLLRALTEDGTRVAALIEVKFGESNFGPCSAFASPDNPSLHVCHQPGLFGSEPDRCFQLLNHGRGRRRYDDYLADLPLQQPSRVADDSGAS